jgi:probable F420-dependent oxidoreductase
MRYGAFFSHPDIGIDPIMIRDWAQAVDGAGFDRVLAAEHVVGGHPDRAVGHQPIHTNRVPYHEPFVLFGFMAAVTRRVELMTSVLVLPQRQTALVAKQAAQIDVLSGGRLRLGIGVGWNAVEFEALREPFDNRGRRSAEQVEVLRALWTQPVVDFRGEFHRISHAGLNPMPVQRPIPVWFGVGSREQPVPPEAALRRIARLADGWSPNFAPDTQGRALVDRVHQYAREGGRDPATLPLEGRIRLAGQGPEGWAKQVDAWKALGATSVIAEPRGAGLKFPDGHLDVLRRFNDMVKEAS